MDFLVASVFDSIGFSDFPVMRGGFLFMHSAEFAGLWSHLLHNIRHEIFRQLQLIGRQIRLISTSRSKSRFSAVLLETSYCKKPVLKTLIQCIGKFIRVWDYQTSISISIVVPQLRLRATGPRLGEQTTKSRTEIGRLSHQLRKEKSEIGVRFIMWPETFSSRPTFDMLVAKNYLNQIPHHWEIY